MHAKRLVAVACTLFTAPALGVERETVLFPAANLRLGKRSKQFADIGENVGVSGRIGAWRTAYRALVHTDHFVDIFESVNALVRHGRGQTTVEMLRQDGVERAVDKRGFARTADTRYTNHLPQWQTQGDVLQIIACAALKSQPGETAGADRRETAGADRRETAGADRREIVGADGFFATQVLRGESVGFEQFGRCALEDQFAAQASGTRTDIQYIIRLAHHLLVMLHDDNSIAHVAQLLERVDKSLVVTLMQTDRRFVQYIQHIHQP